MNSPPKLTKAEQIASLEKQLQDAKLELAALSVQLDAANAAVAGYRRSEAQHLNEVREQASVLAAARAALLPFKVGTDKWDGWPPDDICAVKPITFGDIRRAREAVAKL
jgi:hypothetical protein